MNGRRIKVLRELLKVDPFAMASLLGVHVSTIYRWEASDLPVAMDPMQRMLLEQLNAHALHTSQPAMAKLGDRIVSKLVAGGSLHGLLELLKSVLP